MLFPPDSGNLWNHENQLLDYRYIFKKKVLYFPSNACLGETIWPIRTRSWGHKWGLIASKQTWWAATFAQQQLMLESVVVILFSLDVWLPTSVLLRPSTWHPFNLPKSVCRLAGCLIGSVRYHFVDTKSSNEDAMSWMQVAKLLVPGSILVTFYTRSLTVCLSFVMVMVTHLDHFYISVAFHVLWMVFAFVWNVVEAVEHSSSESSSEETSHPGSRSEIPSMKLSRVNDYDYYLVNRLSLSHNHTDTYCTVVAMVNTLGHTVLSLHPAPLRISYIYSITVLCVCQ